MLSGFLMVFQYQVRQGREDWSQPEVWVSFWARRIFRLSPLYFTLLAVALFWGGTLYASRSAIDAFNGASFQNPSRYMDMSVTNVLLHLTYAFGLSPNYAYRTPLPDWSLGLEMQFYLVFPFLVLAARRIGWLGMTFWATLAGITIALGLLVVGIRFPMPALLALKLHVFLAGMLMAVAPEGKKAGYLAVVLALVMIPIGGKPDLTDIAVRVVMAAGFFCLIHFHTQKLIMPVSRLLSSRPLHWLGEFSYGSYLIHLLILQPVLALLIAHFGRGWAPHEYFVASVVITLGITLPLAAAGYFLIELPGQAMGKQFVRRWIGAPSARQVKAEEIAAP